MRASPASGLGHVKAGARVFLAKLLRPAIRTFAPRIKNNDRSVSRRINLLVTQVFYKSYAGTLVGAECFNQEILAHRIFGDHAWMPRLILRGRRWLVRPFYPASTRLDRSFKGLDASSRFDVARQAMDILFDIFMAGYAHCDFHAQNLFLINGRLILNDFEVMQPYPEGQRPPFPLCYDITGTGLPSPYRTGNMCFTKEIDPVVGIQQLLKVPVEPLLEELRTEIKNEMRVACETFQSIQARHECRSKKIYGSFFLPYMSVSPEDAQRDSAMRVRKLGIDGRTLRGRTVLDLGSNIGAMLFEIQRFGPGRCLGVEYDGKKVAVARKVAAFNGLNNVLFTEADIDELSVDNVAGPFDVVTCLAIEAHVKDKQRLYRLLGEMTSQVLYFEGNSTTDANEARLSLLGCGFVSVQSLGESDDDCVPENNVRPLLVAKK